MSRVLVAEDDAVTRCSLVTVLRREGYAVDEVGDGDEAARHWIVTPYAPRTARTLLIAPPGLTGP